MNNTYVCTSLKQLSTIIHMKSVMGECHIKLSTTYVGVFIHPKESALQLSLPTVTFMTVFSSVPWCLSDVGCCGKWLASACLAVQDSFCPPAFFSVAPAVKLIKDANRLKS